MQQTISLSDDVVRDAHQLAESLGLSLEETFKRAIANLLKEESQNPLNDNQSKSLIPEKRGWPEGYIEALFDNKERDFDLFERPEDLPWTEREELL